MRDLVKPRDTVLDCGANVGWLTLLLSRLVGPCGIVIAFEPNPKVLEALRTNVRDWCNGNTWIEGEAVCEFDKPVRFVSHDAFPQGGQISEGARTEGQTVNILLGRSIDSYCKEHGLSPSFIKMDIEGGELAALHGAEQIIRENRPLLVLEQHRENGTGCMSFLADHGYEALDLMSMETLTTDRGLNLAVTDVLFVPHERSVPALYRKPVKTIIHEIRAEQNSVPSFDLEPGRYFIEIDWQAGSDQFVQQYVKVDGAFAERRDGKANWIHDSYRWTTLYLPRRSQIEIGIGGPADSIDIKRILIHGLGPDHPFRFSAWAV